MSATGYLIWFIVTTVIVVAIFGVAIAGANGVFDSKERAARAAAREERRRLDERRNRGGGTVR